MIIIFLTLVFEILNYSRLWLMNVCRKDYVLQITAQNQHNGLSMMHPQVVVTFVLMLK